jgi:hypothetical protein
MFCSEWMHATNQRCEALASQESRSLYGVFLTERWESEIFEDLSKCGFQDWGTTPPKGVAL